MSTLLNQSSERHHITMHPPQHKWQKLEFPVVKYVAYNTKYSHWIFLFPIPYPSFARLQCQGIPRNAMLMPSSHPIPLQCRIRYSRKSTRERSREWRHMPSAKGKTSSVRCPAPYNTSVHLHSKSHSAWSRKRVAVDGTSKGQYSSRPEFRHVIRDPPFIHHR